MRINISSVLYSYSMDFDGGNVVSYATTARHTLINILGTSRTVDFSGTTMTVRDLSGTPINTYTLATTVLMNGVEYNPADQYIYISETDGSIRKIKNDGTGEFKRSSVIPGSSFADSIAIDIKNKRMVVKTVETGTTPALYFMDTFSFLNTTSRVNDNSFFFTGKQSGGLIRSYAGPGYPNDTTNWDYKVGANFGESETVDRSYSSYHIDQYVSSGDTPQLTKASFS